MTTAAHIADERVLAGTPAVLHVSILDQNGEIDDTVSSCTVTITRADGTALVTNQSATGTAGAFTYTLTGAQTAQLDLLTATWTVSSVVRATTRHEIVGGYYFTIAEARAVDPAFNQQNYSDAQMIAARRDVEDEFERICGVAFVPRFRRGRIRPTGTNIAKAPNPKPRTVTAARIWWSASSYTDLTQTELSHIVCEDDGTIRRSDLFVWPYYADSIEVGLEHGFDRPPADIKRAAMTRLRMRLNMARSGIPDRATSYSVADGGTYRLDTADALKVGVPDIDGVLARYSYQVPIA